MTSQDPTIPAALPGEPDAALLAQAQSRTELGRLTLHEERANVEVVRGGAGSVSVLRRVVEREELVPVQLVRETLEITVQNGQGLVTLNGEALEPGRTYEVLVREERAEVTKQVYALSDVVLSKQSRTVTHEEAVTLRRETLDVRDPHGLTRELAIVDEDLR